MHISQLLRTTISYIPVVRFIVDVVANILSISSASVSDVEAKIKEIEAVGRWLKDNDVNTFTEYYDKTFKKEE